MPAVKPPVLVSLNSLSAAAQVRPAGYLEDCLSRGQIKGDYLILPAEAYEALRLKYSPRGLGDRVARIAKPIARAIDAVTGTDLSNCPDCADRQAWLNAQFPTSGNPSAT